MAPSTPRLVIPIDLTKKPWEQKFTLHNRWHPQIPAVAEVKVGELFRVEMSDWTGGVIKDDDSAVDVKSIDLSTVSMNKTYALKRNLLTLEVNVVKKIGLFFLFFFKFKFNCYYN